VQFAKVHDGKRGLMGVGRKATPTALKELTGNPGRRPINKAEPKAEALDPNPPNWLTGEALNFWGELVSVLLPMGHITEADRTNIVSLSMALAQLKEAHKGIQEKGYLIDSLHGPKANPYVGILDKAQKQIKTLLCELGMTPASRTKVVSLTGTVQADPLTEFLEEGGSSSESQDEDSSSEDLH